MYRSIRRVAAGIRLCRERAELTLRARAMPPTGIFFVRTPWFESVSFPDSP